MPDLISSNHICRNATESFVNQSSSFYFSSVLSIKLTPSYLKLSSTSSLPLNFHLQPPYSTHLPLKYYVQIQEDPTRCKATYDLTTLIQYPQKYSLLKWQSPNPRLAAAALIPPASAPPKQPAPADSAPLWTAHATRLPRRTSLLVRDVAAVSLLTLQISSPMLTTSSRGKTSRAMHLRSCSDGEQGCRGCELCLRIEGERYVCFGWRGLEEGNKMADSKADACSCEKAPDGGLLPTETDFTTKAAGA